MGVLGMIGRAAIGAVAAALSLASAQAESPFPSPLNTGKAWKVYKESWSEEDETGYSAFVQAIGRSNCTTMESCFNSDANPFRSEVDPPLPGDCADMAYVLRAYYAWKMGLPFSYQSAMRTADGARDDLRYSSGGNVVAGRRRIANYVSNAPAFLARIGGEVSTAMFRTHPDFGAHAHDDFYPVEISREAIRPGVIAYDIFGHVGIVYDILEDGRVLVVASHPDNSVTRSLYGPNFMRAEPKLGAGLKAWRPIYVDGATRGEDGALTGGRLRAMKNDALEHFSLEQYIGNIPHPTGEWHFGEFRIADRTLQYYDFVRRRLAAPNFQYDPVAELQFGLEEICGAIKARKTAVDHATFKKIHLRNHPGRLPPNIYGTFGDWEEFSTPSRDARLKVSFIELRRDVQRLVEDVRAGAPGVAYEGDNLADDLLSMFNQQKDACTVTYWRSDNTRMRLNLGHVMDRLFDLSFDPYHCPERRWGAKGAELETCTDDETKAQWYVAQRFLRYQARRTYDIRMDFTLAELRSPALFAPEEGGLGVDAPADADIRAYLVSLQPALTAEAERPIRIRPVAYAPKRIGAVFLPGWHARLAARRADPWR